MYYSLRYIRDNLGKQCPLNGASRISIVPLQISAINTDGTLDCQLSNGFQWETVGVNMPRQLYPFDEKFSLDYTYNSAQEREQTDLDSHTCIERITPQFYIGEEVMCVLTMSYEKQAYTNSSYHYNLVERWDLLDNRVWAEVDPSDPDADNYNDKGLRLQMSPNHQTLQRAVEGDVPG